MMNYRCCVCETKFDNPYEEDYKISCPRCGSRELQESDTNCAVCGEAIFRDDDVVKIGTEMFCTNCAEVGKML